MDPRSIVVYGLTASFTRVQRCVEDVSDSEAVQTPHNLTPIIWQLGHLALSDGGFLRLAGGTSPAPELFKGFFKTGSGGPAGYPPLGEVKPVFEAAQRELERLAQFANLEQPVESRNCATIGEMLIFAAYHRGYHIGKMTTLRALLGKPRLFG
ncbi:MAG: DinB family protein [Bacillati bacterium ANGP1]|uniref:DinB family protein n=1 Tax=Candidatus Segetimicrobium genomatis TaxID=2569760 RepID=A0A537L6Y3_9BACT|nr:MAG: DinB family protein [Terrabacteria group bacterium ANGP1]